MPHRNAECCAVIMLFGKLFSKRFAFRQNGSVIKFWRQIFGDAAYKFPIWYTDISLHCLTRMMGACYLLIFVKVREEIYTSTEEMSLLNSHVSTLELTNAYRCQLCAGKQVRVRKTLNKYSQMRCNCLYVSCSLKIPKCGLDVINQMMQ
ncbi:hypothetical protein T02_10913 [Trichinella nativa]|uniref:PiggyBac transposable element-derived protein domain-containing protein n=1 Tax=Trichinella nativa TaxID=6335 RepID=A0A0V1L5N2_9BILA|nr:hypothetical protein T06_16142 [Trichinella sp. T6]KRZ54840.1 hypothetical protein T02_10913 [Trichinella nativa]